VYNSELETIMDKRSWLILYWCEGSKKHFDLRTDKYVADRVELTTSEPEMASIYIRGLREFYTPDESRLRCELSIHTVQQAQQREIQQFRSDLLDIALSQFSRTQIRKTVTKHSDLTRARLAKYGIIKIRYFDSRLAREILAEIEQLKKELQ
jgi:hypothetical protein